MSDLVEVSVSTERTKKCRFVLDSDETMSIVEAFLRQKIKKAPESFGLNKDDVKNGYKLSVELGNWGEATVVITSSHDCYSTIKTGV